ncbi:MAG: LTA synthase family protein, partial [Polyangiales bacterium]
GLHRNAGVALVRSVWQRRAHLDLSVEKAPLEPSGRALDFSHLAGAARGKNIVWVILESTGAQYLAPYGASVDPMPNLTRLAEHALVFENAYAVHPESIKGLYSMLCSFAPAPHVEADAYAADRLPCTSIAATFAQAGYRTGFFHSGRFAYLGMTHVVENRGFDQLEDAGNIGGKFESSFGVDDASTARRTLEFIDARKGQPFFAVYSNISGHHPYTTPGEGARPFGEDDDYHRYLSDLHRGDLALGLLIEGLRSRGLLDDTVWVVHGDHGEAFFQHENNFAHSLFIYEENVRVPFLVVVPGAFDRAVRAPQIASLLDLAPTLADLAGLPASPRWQGGSLLAPTPRIARFFVDQAVWQAGLRDGDWKLVTEIESGRSHLFDLARDPDERLDLAAGEPARVDLYRKHLLAWQASARASVGR